MCVPLMKYMHTSLCVQMCVCVYLYLSAYVYVPVNECMYASALKCTCVFWYICINAFICLHVCVYFFCNEACAYVYAGG